MTTDHLGLTRFNLLILVQSSGNYGVTCNEYESVHVHMDEAH